MLYLIARALTGCAAEDLPTFRETLEPQTKDTRTAQEIKNDILARMME